MTVFFAHPRSAEDSMILAAANAVRAYLTPGTQLVRGRDDFEATFKSFASIRRWSESVAARYDGIVVMPVDGLGAVGSATAEIIEAALRREKPVLIIYPDGNALPCVSVQKRSGRARDGWSVEVSA